MFWASTLGLTAASSIDNGFCGMCVSGERQSLSSAGHIILPNGLGLVAGGDKDDLSWPFLTNGLASTRIVDPFQASYTLGPGLPSSRWYPSLLTLADSNILIMGGAQVRQSHSLRAGQ